MTPPLDILYHDDRLVAINKPHGLLVHPSAIARDVKETALHLLKDQLGKYLYPVHRLDRKTSGVLVFALDKEMANTLRMSFDDKLIHKNYVAIVRGHFNPQEYLLDYPLINENGVEQEASTHFKLIKTTEIPLSSGRYDTSRYSLIECIPHTGRFHQIRKHLAHLRFPIIGDRPHGCNKQNRFFKQQWNMMTMMLHAHRLTMPYNESTLSISADYSDEFKRMAYNLDLVSCLYD